jgi:hypothetical protein
MLDGGSTIWSTGGLALAAMLARAASRNRRFAYAIALYAISRQNHVNHPMDLHPALYPYRALIIASGNPRNAGPWKRN